MNPFSITLLTLVAWTIVTIIALFFSSGGGALPILFGSFYFAPITCLVAFITSSTFYPSWVKKNKNTFTVSLASLVFWLLAVTAIYIMR